MKVECFLLNKNWCLCILLHLCLLPIFLPLPSNAQETISPLPSSQNLRSQALSLRECEQLFLKTNLLLLAEQFSIEKADAAALQATLWDNPTLSLEVNAFYPEKQRFFEVGDSGQKALTLQQIIYLGGKKQNQIDLAKANATLARLQFQDLLRTLKFRLRRAYFALHYDRIILQSLDRQLLHLDTLIIAYTEQTEKGILPYKDVVRLQGLYFELQSDRNERNNTINETHRELQTLLATSAEIVPMPLAEELSLYESRRLNNVDSLQKIASTHRPDLAFTNTSIGAAEINFALQQSLAVPDIVLGGSYDQRGGAFANQINLTLGVTLPLWNRNQGNIALAEAELRRTKTVNTAQALDVRNEVALAFRTYQTTLKNLASIRPKTEQNFEAVYNGMILNFQRRNISMLEFTDFIESYTRSILHIADLRKQLAEACETLNLVTATTLY